MFVAVVSLCVETWVTSKKHLLLTAYFYRNLPQTLALANVRLCGSGPEQKYAYSCPASAEGASEENSFFGLRTFSKLSNLAQNLASKPDLRTR